MLLPRVVLFALFAAIVAAGAVVTCESQRLNHLASLIGPPETRRFPRLGLVAAGTGGTYENPERLGPVMAVGFGERVVLVDAGRATSEALRRARIAADQPDTVYLTSVLPENVLGLEDLVVSAWLAPRTKPLRVVGPAGTHALVEGLEAAERTGVEALAKSLGLDPALARVEVLEVGDGFEESAAGLTARAGALAGGPVPALAWRFEAGGHSLVVCGAGWDPAGLERLARGAEILALGALNPASVESGEQAGGAEAARLRGEAALHARLDQVGGIAERAGVQTLLLVRLLPPPLRSFHYTRVVRRTFGGTVVVAEDGDEILTR
jgi:ribonuclease BN (tRNA processing enzyme)